jgi:hypothetical protein
VACALLQAARVLGSDERAARELGLHAARRWDPATLPSFVPENTPQALDWRENPFLCHGSGARGHVFNRLYHYTGDETFAAAARVWFARTVVQARPADEAGLIWGAPGVGLALLAAATPLEPRWDRLMMLSLALPPGV